MADKSRLSDILKQEYQSKGIVGGLASAAGKRIREKLDIRNALFGGSGVGSLIGRKIFGKGYSAIGDKSNSADKLSSQTTPILAAQSDKLDVISTNTQISAKNSMALPSMARDMNVMRQNIIKMVKLQGGTPTNKADAFFSKAKDRESMYESLFGKKEKTTPTKVTAPEKKKSLADMLLGMLGPIGVVIAGLVAAIETGISSLKTAFDLFKSALGGFAEWILKKFVEKSLTGGGTPDLPGTPDKTSKPGEKPAGKPGGVGKWQWLGRAAKLGVGLSLLTHVGNAGMTQEEENAELAKRRAKGFTPTPTPNSTTAEGMKNYKSRADSVTPSKITADDDAKLNAERYLGAGMTSTDWDLLKRAVYAESSRNEQEYANVMAVILNRARKSGKTIPEVLWEKNQFQAVTGAKGEGSSPQFRKGPDARSAQLIMSSTNSLNNISTSLDSFTAANSAAYGAVGGEAKFNKKMAEMQAANGKTIGGTVFAENLYRPSTTGQTLSQSSTQMAALARAASTPEAPIVNIDNSQRNTTTSGGGGSLGPAETIDVELGKLLLRMAG